MFRLRTVRIVSKISGRARSAPGARVNRAARVVVDGGRGAHSPSFGALILPTPQVFQPRRSGALPRRRTASCRPRASTSSFRRFIVVIRSSRSHALPMPRAHISSRDRRNSERYRSCDGLQASRIPHRPPAAASFTTSPDRCSLRSRRLASVLRLPIRWSPSIANRPMANGRASCLGMSGWMVPSGVGGAVALHFAESSAAV